MVSKGFPNVTTSGRRYNIGEKPSVILYTHINLHAGTQKKTKSLRALDYSVVIIIIIIIIISAHKSDLSYPWSQTQASLSIPSLHPKNTNKRREREEKNNRRENLPRSDRRGREKIKQEQKNKSKDPPRISERQIDKQARQTKCQDHTNCRYRTRVAKHTPPVAGRGAADSQALRQGAPV